MAQPNELPEKFPCWCRAKYSWGGQTKKDLGFIEGDLIECLNAGDGSWWMGRLKRDKRQIGLFPSNFVVLLEGDQALTGRSEGSLPDTQKSLDKKGTRSSYQAVEKESSDSRWKQSPMPPAMKQGDTDNISPAPIPPPHRHSISDTSRRMLMAMSPHLPQASTASEAPDLVSSKNPWAKFATQSTSDPNPDTLTQPVNFGSKAGRRHSLGIEETNSANTTKLPVAIRDFGDTPSKLASGRPENDIQDDLEIVYSGFTTSTRATSGAYSIATASSAQSSITNSSVFSSLSSASTDKSSVASSSSLARKGIEPKKANPFRSAFFENLIRNSKEKRAAKAPTFAHWKESNSEQASASTLAGYDWVSVRRDVNRSSTPGPADQEERILQTRSLDEPHMYPVEELYESQTNGESRDGSHVQDPFKLIDNFDLIDERVKHFVSLPSRITAAVLATSFLCRPYKSEISKIRAIFVWCSSQLHWQQDEDTVSHHSKQADTSLVIQQREGTSRGIAAVVQDMCNAVGVVVEMIEGQFKTPAEGHIMMHWWNAVLIHNEWRFMDACLAQPNFIKSSTLIEKASKLEFFLTIPVELCWTHVPADHCQQHLLPCVSTTLLLALPSAYPAFFQLGLSLHKYNLSMIKLRGLEMCVVNLNVPEDIEIVAEVKVAGQIQGGIDSSTVNTELLQALALAQPKWYRIGHNVRLKRYTIKAALPSGVTSGSLKIYAGKRGLTHSRKGNVRPLALIVPISHLGSENPEFKFCRRHATPHATRNDLYLSQPQCLYLLRNCTYVFQVLQHAATVPSDDDSEGNKERPAKMAIQSPSGKIIRLLRNTNSVPSQTSKEKDLESEVLGTSYETVIKVGETGIWRGLVLADRSARWCVWAEWQCIDGLKRHDNHDPHTEALTANESRQTDAESVVIESGLGKPPLRSGDVLSEESVSPTRNDEELAKERFKIPRSELENVLKLHAESINHDKVVANHPLQAGTAAIRTPSVIAESVEEVGDSDATGSFKNPWDPDSFEKLVHFTSAPKEKETGKDLPQLPLSPIDSIETLIKTIEDDLLREDKASHRSDTLSHVGDAHDTAEIQQSHPTESKTLDMDPPQSLVAVSPDQPIDLSCKDSNFFELKDSSSAQAHLVQTDPSRTARSEQSQIAIDFSEFGSQKSLGDEHVHVTPSDDFSKGLETEDSISNDDEMVAKSEADFREDSTRPGVEEGPVAQLNPLRLDDEGRSYQGIWYWAVDAVKSNCTSVAALFGWSLFTTRETNKVAITWTCGCGKKMSARITELRHGAALRLQEALRASAERTRSHLTQSAASSAGSDRSSGVTATSLAPSTTQGTQSPDSSSQASRTGSTSAISTSTSSAGGASPSTDPAQHRQFLLTCFDLDLKSELVQIDLTSITHDEYMFNLIRQEYTSFNRRMKLLRLPSVSTWIRKQAPPLATIATWIFQINLTKAVGIDFVRFRLVPLRQATAPWNFVSPSFPPEQEVRRQNYLYQPCPQDEYEVAGLNSAMLHELMEPGPHLDGHWISSFPKKLNLPLAYIPNQGGALVVNNVAWGIRIRQGLNWKVVVVITITISAVAAVVFSIVARDPGGAFAMASYAIAIVMVGLQLKAITPS